MRQLSSESANNIAAGAKCAPLEQHPTVIISQASSRIQSVGHPLSVLSSSANGHQDQPPRIAYGGDSAMAHLEHLSHHHLQSHYQPQSDGHSDGDSSPLQYSTLQPIEHHPHGGVISPSPYSAYAPQQQQQHQLEMLHHHHPAATPDHWSSYNLSLDLSQNSCSAKALESHNNSGGGSPPLGGDDKLHSLVSDHLNSNRYEDHVQFLAEQISHSEGSASPKAHHQHGGVITTHNGGLHPYQYHHQQPHHRSLVITQAGNNNNANHFKSSQHLDHHYPASCSAATDSANVVMRDNQHLYATPATTTAGSVSPYGQHHPSPPAADGSSSSAALDSEMNGCMLIGGEGHKGSPSARESVASADKCVIIETLGGAKYSLGQNSLHHHGVDDNNNNSLQHIGHSTGVLVNALKDSDHCVLTLESVASHKAHGSPIHGQQQLLEGNGQQFLNLGSAHSTINENLNQLKYAHTDQGGSPAILLAATGKGSEPGSSSPEYESSDLQNFTQLTSVVQSRNATNNLAIYSPTSQAGHQHHHHLPHHSSANSAVGQQQVGAINSSAYDSLR